jgi:hypothetical protein
MIRIRITSTCLGEETEVLADIPFFDEAADEEQINKAVLRIKEILLQSTEKQRKMKQGDSDLIKVLLEENSKLYKQIQDIRELVERFEKE